MLALKQRQPPRACLGTHPEVLAEALQEGVNLAVWQRRLAPQVEDFVRILLAQPLEVADGRRALARPTERGEVVEPQQFP